MNRVSVSRSNVNVVTVEQAKKLFINEKIARGLADDSIDNMLLVIDKFVEYSNLSMKDNVKDITLDVVYEWIDVLKERGNKVTSINSYLTRLRVFLYWCMKNEYIDSFKISLLKGQEETIKYYTDEELSILIKRPDKKCGFVEYRTWVIVCFILATGARAATISNIMLDDVDLKGNMVVFRHLKNKKVANIPLSSGIANILIEYLKTWNTGSEYLFCDVGGGILTTSAIRQAFNKYCKSRGVKALGPHALRHSFARGWIRNGGGVFQLQMMLTHSDLTMTKRYVRLFSEDLSDDVREFSPLDNLKRGSSRTKRVTRV